MTSVEEFGIAAVESRGRAGRPGDRARSGGALETVLDGVTGCFWSGGADELATAVLEFDDAAVDPEACVRQAARFDASAFRRDLMREVEVAGPAPVSADGTVATCRCWTIDACSVQPSRWDLTR